MLRKKNFFMLLFLCFLLVNPLFGQISVDPEEFAFDNTPTGVIFIEEITLTNDGDAEIGFTAEIETDLRNRNLGPRRDNPGDLLAQYQSAIQEIGGMAFDGELMWGSSYSSNQMAAMTLDGQQVRTVNINNSPISLGFDGELFWASQWSDNQIYLYDLEGNRVDQFNLNFGQIGGIGSDCDEFMYMNSMEDQRIHVISIENHQEVRAFEYRQAMGNANIWGTDWVPSHPDGQLWGNIRGHVYQAYVDDDWNVHAVQDFAWRTDQDHSEPCHDGENMWHGMWSERMWYVYDDGVVEMNWIGIVPEDGDIPRLENNEPGEFPLELLINAIGLEQGQYAATITFSFDEGRDIVVEVNMEIIEGPAILHEFDDEAWESVQEWDFGEAWVGFDNGAAFCIENVGQEDLVIEEIASDDPDNFHGAEPPNGGWQIEPGEEVEIWIYASPVDVGEVEGVLTFVSNAINMPDGFPISVHAIGILPPLIGINPDRIEDDLVTGEIHDHVITLSNDGDHVLNFEIDHEFPEEDRDDAPRGVRSTDRNLGPRRDEVDLGGMMFAVLQDNSNWGWLDDGMMERDPLLTRNGEDANYVTFRDGNAWNNIEFEEYDAIIWEGNHQSGNFNNAYNANLERFMEYLDGGGGAYTETSDQNAQIRLPGGFTNNADGNNNGTLVVSPDPNADNYSLFAEICHESQPNFWLEGERIEGGSWLHSSYDQGQFQQALDNGTIEWFQTIAVPEGRQTAGAIAYGIGGGTVLAVGHPTGHCWQHYNQEGMWGSIAAEILYYLTQSGSTNWITYEPTEGVLQPGDDTDIIVTLDPGGLFSGDYACDLLISSNAPNNPNAIVPVIIHVTGAPHLSVVWDDDIGFPEVVDWNEAFFQVFSGGPYRIDVELLNDGTDLLVIEDVASDHEYFSSDFEAEIQIAAGESVPMTFTFNCPLQEPDDYNAVMTFVWNSPNGDDTEIALHALAESPPIISVDPVEIEEDVFLGAIFEPIILIANDGQADLIWTSEFAVVSEPGDDQPGRSVRSTDGSFGPRRDNPGDLLAQYQSAIQEIGGMAFDGELMWGSSYSSNQMAAMTLDGQQVRTVNINGSPISLGFDGELFWASQWSGNQIYRYDLEGNRVDQFNMNFGQIGGIGSDCDEYMYMNSMEDQQIHVIRIDNHQEVRRFAYRQAMGNANIWGTDWVPSHPDGQLWGNIRGRVYQAYVDDDWNVHAVQNFAWRTDQDHSEPCHDGENMWHGMWSQRTWFVYDDGVVEMNWFAYEPTEGVVGAESEAEIFLTINAAGLTPGLYEGDLFIFCNDPADPETVVRIAITVLGAPDVDAEWDEDFGYPGIMDWNLGFDEVFTGGPYTIPVVLSNLGIEPLHVARVYSEHNCFSSDFENEIDLDPEETINVAFIFNAPANEPDDYSTVMIVESDDPDEGELEIRLHAEALRPPVIDADPNEIEDDIITGASNDYVITLSNSGDAVLIWETEWELVESPEQDQIERQVRSTDRNVGPRRDEVDLEGMMFAVLQDNSNWGWLDDGMMERDPLLTRNGEDANYVTFRDGNAWNNIEFEEYDAIIWEGNHQSGNFNNAYNANLERFMEYLDGGGGAYTETSDQNAQIRLPGGFTNNADGNNNGTLVVSPDPNADNYSLFAEICHESQPNFWLEGERIEGGSWLHSSYDQGQFQQALDNGTIEWFQTIAVPEGRQTAGAIAYGIGGGTVLAVGHPTGHCWQHYNQEGMWGSIAAEILYYLTSSGGMRGWFTYEPTEGEIAQDEEEDIFIHIDAGGLLEGAYVVDFHILNNDPANPDLVVVITMNVIGAPNIVVEWDEDYGFPDIIDWNEAFDPLFSGGPNHIPVLISNTGTDPLEIAGFNSDHDFFMTDADDGLVVDPGASAEVMFIFNADAEDPGDYNATITIASNDPDQDEIVIDLHADAESPPRISVDPGEIVEETFVGSIFERVITIANDGEADLVWSSEFEIISEPEQDQPGRSVRSTDGSFGPRRDNPGDLLAQYQSAIQEIGGMAFDGELMWGSSYSSNQMAAMTLDGQQVRTVNINNSPISLGFDGELFWASQWSDNQIYLYDLEGNRVDQFNLNFGQIGGIGSDCDEFMYMNSMEDQRIHVISIENHQEVRAFEYRQAMGNANIWGTDWVPSHPDGQLWGNIRGHVYQAYVDDDWNVHAVQDFAWRTDQDHSEPCHDGENMWHGMWNERMWYVYDDGVVEMNWFAYEPDAGTVEPDREVEIFVTINCVGLIEGLYEAELTIFSNDPGGAVTVINVEIQVAGAPGINVTWEDDFGYPALIDWNLAFEEVFAGGPYVIPVMVSNFGTEELVVENFISDNDYFSSNFEDVIELDVEEATELIFTFNADEPDDYDATMTITSNDPDDAEYIIRLHAEAMSPPIIVVEPLDMADALDEGVQAEHTFTIGNDGEALLRWKGELEVVREPVPGEEQRDRQVRRVRSTEGNQVGPRRDEVDLEGMTFACFQTSDNWGWLDDGFWRDPLLNNENFVSFRNANAWNEVDFEDYDAVVMSTFQQNFNNEYNANYERFCEYIAGGGGLYTEMGDANQGVRTPGGIMNDWGINSSNGYLVVSPDPDDENYSLFAEICHESQPNFWNIDERIEGSSWLHSGFQRQQFDQGVDNGTLEWYQVIAVHENDRNAPGAVAYGYGGGTVLVTGHPVGHCWQHYNQEGMWGSIAAEILYYLTQSGSAKWCVFDPVDGTVEADSETEVFVTLGAEGLYSGTYEGNLHILNNDPSDPDVIVSITLDITGTPEVELVWSAGCGYPDRINWNRAFPAALYSSGAYPVPVTFINHGTGNLHVESIVNEDGSFYADPGEDFIVGFNFQRVVNFYINADEDGMHAGNMIIRSDDPDNPEISVRCVGETTPPPRIAVDPPDPIEDALVIGESSEHALNVANEGEVDLNWWTDFDAREPGDERDGTQRCVREIDSQVGPVRDDIGEVLGQYVWNRAGGNQYKNCAYDMDNDWMWLATYSPNYIKAVSFDNNYDEIVTEVNDFQPNDNPMDIAWIGGRVYAIPWSENYLLKIDSEGRNLGNVNTPFRPCGIGASVELDLLMIMDDGNYNIHVFELSDDGQLGREIGIIENYRQFIQNQGCRNVEWVDAHPDGQLWLHTSSQTLYQIAVNTDNWDAIGVVQSLANFGCNQEWGGVAHDGTNIWHGGYQLNNYQIIDDGTAEVRWFSYEPDGGTLEPGEDTEIIITLNAENILGGLYEVELNFYSNDPVQIDEVPDVTIPISLEVTGIPDIVVDPGGEDHGQIDFEVVNIGFPETVMAHVLSPGTDRLIIREIVSDNAVFHVSDEVEFPVIFQAQSEGFVPLVFDPVDAGMDQEATLLFMTNVEGLEDGYPVFVTGDGLIPPEIRLSANMHDFGAVQEINGRVMWTLQISNDGGDNLLVEISVEGEMFASFARAITVHAGRTRDVEIRFRPTEEGEHVGRLTIRSNDPANPEVFVDLRGFCGDQGFYDLAVTLSRDWNMISINVVPPQEMWEIEDGPDIILMTEQLRFDEENHNVIIMKNQDGLFYMPAWGFNNIPYWNLTQGYMIKLTEEVETVWSGDLIPADADIPLRVNWNLSAYFPTYDLDASAPDFYVLSPIIENVVLAKDKDGRFLSPAFNFSNMNPWTEGQGYQLKIISNEPIVLNYPPEQDVAATYIGADVAAVGHWTAPVSTGENMSVLLNSISGHEFAAGDQIAAYSTSGVLLGKGDITGSRCGLPIWGDDISSEKVEGATHGEAFALKLWDSVHKVERNLEVVAVHIGNGLIYEVNAFTVLDVNIQVAVPDDYYLLQNYPNPFNNVTKLAYGMSETGDVSIQVFDLTGRFVATLVNGNTSAGNHVTVWDASFSPTGIYLIQMETSSGYKAVRKVMLVK